MIFMPVLELCKSEPEDILTIKKIWSVDEEGVNLHDDETPSLHSPAHGQI